MAKTRKPAGSSASRRPRRKSVTPRRRAGGGGGRRDELDLRPLKQQIKKHIDRLSVVEKPGKRTRAALASLRRVQRDLTRACMPTMVIPSS